MADETPPPVVAEVRRAGLDLKVMEGRLAWHERDPTVSVYSDRAADDVRDLLAEVSRLTAERDEITGTPERWMRWCDHRVLERAEQAEADLATLRARLLELEQQWRDCADTTTDPDSQPATRTWIRCADELAALLPPPTET